MAPLCVRGLLLWLSCCLPRSLSCSLPNSMMSNPTLPLCPGLYPCTFFFSFFRKKTCPQTLTHSFLPWSILRTAFPHLPEPLPRSDTALAECTVTHLPGNCPGTLKWCLLDSDGPSTQFLLPGLFCFAKFILPDDVSYLDSIYHIPAFYFSLLFITVTPKISRILLKMLFY